MHLSSLHSRPLENEGKYEKLNDSNRQVNARKVLLNMENTPAIHNNHEFKLLWAYLSRVFSSVPNRSICDKTVLEKLSLYFSDKAMRWV